MKFGSLFSGIGGFDLGLERAGMECAWQVEIDPFCQKVLAKHWPGVERYSDVRECGKHNLTAVDLICGGFPCQPHSVAGKRRGAADDRDLWPEYRRLIAELHPRWVVGENVPGIRTTILDQVLSDLDDMDYETAALVIPACAFDAPHRRERIFIIAYTDSWNSYRRTESREGRTNGIGLSCERRSIEDVANSEGWKSREQTQPEGRQDISRVSEEVNDVANSQRVRCNPGDGRQEGEQPGRGRQACCEPAASGGSDATDTSSKGLQEWDWDRDESRESCTSVEFCNWWAIEPPVGRVADGVPRRVDRLRALGNAVVPQVVEWLGRQIVEVDTCFRQP